MALRIRLAVSSNVAPAATQPGRSGTWALYPVSEAPDPVPRTSVERLQVAAYDGPGKIEARVYELSSFEVGLDLAKRWRPSADTVFFQQGRYFVVVKWQQADRKALQEFMREMEKRLPAAKPLFR